jgi:RNA polymerase sigma factor (sigma-70 family)
MPIKVTIVEDDSSTRKAWAAQVKRAPALSLIASYASPKEALTDMPGNLPDVVLMDVNLSGCNGIECITQLKTRYPKLQILILTNSEHTKQIFAALRAGAGGYLMKGATQKKLVAAIEEVHSGGAPLSASVARKVVSSFHKADPSCSSLEKLTPREQAILALLAQSKHYKEIATELGISTHTVRNHLHEIYSKLQVHSRTEAVLKFLNY